MSNFAIAGLFTTVTVVLIFLIIWIVIRSSPIDKSELKDEELRPNSRLLDRLSDDSAHSSQWNESDSAADSHVQQYKLPGDATTNAPPPVGDVKKKRKGD